MMKLMKPENKIIEEFVETLGGDEYSRKAVDLLVENCERGYIDLSGLSEEEKFEISLILSYFDLAHPLTAINSSLAWKSRLISHSTNKLEIPYIVREIFRSVKNGNFELEKIVENYFRKIGERKPSDFFEIFKEITNEAENNIVCGNTIVKASQKRNRDGGVVIAELKGSGLISPFAGCGNAFQSYGKKYQSPVYEINRFVRLLIEGYKSKATRQK
ncbi:hypothetical protein [Archaeoglobus sulfaticallidus]|nr:hypothetical protein [Archaeoglobus sulfaticallidus]